MKPSRYILGFLIVANLFLWHFILFENSRNFLTVIFLDVGQGDAILIEAPNGNQVLIDGGPDGRIVREISKFISYYDKSINLIIATHPDLDHIGGFPDFIDKYQIETYSFYNLSSTSSLTEQINQKVAQNFINTHYLKAGDRIILDDEAQIYLDILWPTEKYTKNDKNELSIVAKLTYGESKFLFTGDAGIEVEEVLVAEYGDELDVDVLKLGHHGSKTSTSQKFLESTTPEYVVVSAGRENRYNHPHDEVISRVRDFISEENILKTTDGSVVLKSDGEKIWPR